MPNMVPSLISYLKNNIYIYIYIERERERETEREREKQIVIPLLKWYSLANKDDTSFHRQPLLPFSDHFHCHDRESENRTEPILSVWLLYCELDLDFSSLSYT